MTTNKTFEELIGEITAWQDETFPSATPLTAAIHLSREAKELVSNLATNEMDTYLEIADCFFLIVGVAHLAGIDLRAAAQKKMEINKRRQWGKPDTQGVVEHVRPETDEENIFIRVSEPNDLGWKIKWDGEKILWKGKTLAEVFSEDGPIPDGSEKGLPEDFKNLFSGIIKKEGNDGPLPID